MLTFVLAALAFAASCFAGNAAVRAFADDVPPPSRAKKAALFLAGFVGWPFTLLAFLAVIVVCWDLLWLPDPDDCHAAKISNGKP